MDIIEQKSAERYYGGLPAGLRSFRRCLKTGYYVAIFHSREAYMDPCVNEYTGEEEGTYSLVCEMHSQILSVPNMALARRHMTNPMDWCEMCSGVQEEEWF